MNSEQVNIAISKVLSGLEVKDKKYKDIVSISKKMIVYEDWSSNHLGYMPLELDFLAITRARKYTVEFQKKIYAHSRPWTATVESLDGKIVSKTANSKEMAVALVWLLFHGYDFKKNKLVGRGSDEFRHS